MSEQNLYSVLVVEDDQATQEIIKANLEEEYLLTQASSMTEAMNILQDKQFDLILLDIGLPDGSGFDICKEVKANVDTYGEVVIIFITSLDQPADEVEGLRLGGSDYITKPIHAAVLKARMKLQIELLRKTQLLSQLARIDGLTEISNRRAFDDHLLKSWNHARRISVPLTLAMIDVDFFKQYNDIYGHPAGDYCLKQVAKCLQTVVKRGSDHVARVGGEEFAVLLFDCELAQAQEVIEAIQQLFASMDIEHSGSTLARQVTLSIGICTAFPEMDDMDQFVNVTDSLLYQAKKVGRNRIESSYFHRVEL